ncbi:hypothetical protein L3Q65_06330 [Amycolatopsis sp. FU40]|uniref:hypothetical protein n=1 Tax=Amycolatopsis sp. FU40 TaxID=2914159 RepID=UPI001F46B17F|nr:hypothetical protein [Amycolatopsis sp. FU40]UKD56331.1 hypothetical protein L3Q65_06330 [Amycolatopsis sp. FU40]
MIRPVSNRLLLRCGAVAAAAALACTACSGSGSGENAAQPPAAASSPAAPASPSAAPLDAATVGETVKAAMKKSTAVHVKGSKSEDGKMKVDMQFNKDSVSGSIEKDGVEVPMLRVGEKVWMRFSKSLTKEAGLPAEAAAMVNDKWVSLDSPLAQGMGEVFKLFMDFDVFVGSMADDVDKPGYSAAEPADVAGTPALRYKNGSRTIFLEAAGSHRLLRLESPSEGTMEFSGWDQPVPAKAPPAAEIYSGPGS